MDFEDLELLRRANPAWRLLCADNAPLVLSFLGRVFVGENAREISTSELTNLLDDELYALNQRLGEASFPKSAKAYLEDWSNPGAGWLRKYYAVGQDEPQFDVLPAVEKAVSFVGSLRSREFIGTESRLNTLLDLLRQMAYGTSDDPVKRLAELHRQRAAIDRQIADVEAGNLTMLDSAGQRDRFQQFASIARELLSDFREVEANFRELDARLRAQIAGWTGSKGELLEDVLANRGDISSSEQGRSFSAFYDFLLSADRQTEFEQLLEQVLALQALADADPRTRRIHYDWLAAGERTQSTVRLLSEQLRRFLDDSVWLENRRIIEILNSVQAHAVSLRDRQADLPGTDLDAFAPELGLPLERRLYEPSRTVPIDSVVDETDDAHADSSALFEQTYVDAAALVRNVRDALATRPQVSLPALLDERPLDEGLAELLTYFALADERFAVVFDETSSESVRWRGADEAERIAVVPKVSFVRNLASGRGR
jgi:hypothetical protein